MRLTERLNVEHGVFLRQLEYVRELVRVGVPHATALAATRTIAAALAAHDELEERLLYPLLVRALGGAYPPLVKAAEEHRGIADALDAITAGRFDESRLESFLDELNAHLEHEIHVVFPLADAWIPIETLESLGNWNVEHVVERATAATAPEH